MPGDSGPHPVQSALDARRGATLPRIAPWSRECFLCNELLKLEYPKEVATRRSKLQFRKSLAADARDIWRDGEFSLRQRMSGKSGGRQRSGSGRHNRQEGKVIAVDDRGKRDPCRRQSAGARKSRHAESKLET